MFRENEYSFESLSLKKKAVSLDFKVLHLSPHPGYVPDPYSCTRNGDKNAILSIFYIYTHKKIPHIDVLVFFFFLREKKCAS